VNFQHGAHRQLGNPLDLLPRLFHRDSPACSSRLLGEKVNVSVAIVEPVDQRARRLAPRLARTNPTGFHAHRSIRNLATDARSAKNVGEAVRNPMTVRLIASLRGVGGDPG
jgi:hypothetical protein